MGGLGDILFTFFNPIESQKKHIILLSRALSLLPMNLKSAQWTGPLNRDLLAFNGFAKDLNRSYRNLLEMLTLSFFLNGLVKKDRDDYYQITDRYFMNCCCCYNKYLTCALPV